MANPADPVAATELMAQLIRDRNYRAAAEAGEQCLKRNNSIDNTTFWLYLAVAYTMLYDETTDQKCIERSVWAIAQLNATQHNRE